MRGDYSENREYSRKTTAKKKINLQWCQTPLGMYVALKTVSVYIRSVEPYASTKPCLNDVAAELRCMW